MRQYWIISDTHFCHTKLIEQGHRPADFEERIKRHLRVVKPGDILIHLGDICMGNDAVGNSFLKDIKCTKILVRGNHDHKTSNWYIDHGWDFVCRTFTDKYFQKKVIFSHEPYMFLDDRFDYNIHGHLHDLDPSHHPEYVKSLSSKHILISMEKQKYKPVNLRTLLDTVNR